MSSEKLAAFPFYGGKRDHLDFILPRLPATNTYVEPFGGSAAVLLSREPSPVEVYNDVDGDLVTFFRVLRDDPEELIRQIRATPYAREEYETAIAVAGDDSVDDLERARCFFIRANQVYAGLAQYATPGRWSFSRVTSDRNIATPVNSWLHNADELDRVADRIQRIQIENDDALTVVERYDSDETLVYADPPYPFEARGKAGGGAGKPVAYGNELDDLAHSDLAEVLKAADAKVAVSSYRSNLYDRLFDDWHVVEADSRKLKTKHKGNGDEGRAERREALYCNYDPETVVSSNQSTLADVVSGGGGE